MKSKLIKLFKHNKGKTVGKISFILLCVLVLSCHDNPEPPDSSPIVLISSDEASCTEAWIRLKMENIQLPVDVKVFQSDSVIYELHGVATQDSIFVIDSLKPSQTYDFHFSIRSSGKAYSSNSIEVTTMDTTSHNYTWQSWTFGDIGSSSFSDCAIINENDIWCVGEIMLRDTSENGYSIYNAAHWDGNTWAINKIMFYTECSLSYKNAYPASAIQVFPGNEALVTVEGNQVTKLENGVQDKIFCVPGTMLIKTQSKMKLIFPTVFPLLCLNNFISFDFIIKLFFYF